MSRYPLKKDSRKNNLRERPEEGCNAGNYSCAGPKRSPELKNPLKAEES